MADRPPGIRKADDLLKKLVQVDKADVTSSIQVDILRCSACDKRFHVVVSKKSAKCSHCGFAYVRRRGEWYAAPKRKKKRKRKKK